MNSDFGKRITFVTTGQPTTNPRLVKEVELLIASGYQVRVICSFYERWAEKFDQEITAQHPDVYHYCGGSPNQGKWRYFFTRARQKSAFRLFSLISSFGVAENAICRAHREALALARKFKSDLYIAHNLGALPAAVMAAAYHHAKVGYDAEDMHSGQYHDVKDRGYLLNAYIEKKYFPFTHYFTAASELIGNAYKSRYAYLHPLTLNNVFPKTHLHVPSGITGNIKLFWFSQTIGANRGVENIVSALGRLKVPVELHLLGNCSVEYKNTLYAHAEAVGGRVKSWIYFHQPIAAKEIFGFASQFDIGVASEPAYCLNNDIALSNKIFTYIQCGLAVLASDTKAQSLLLSRYPAIGKLYTMDDEVSLAEAISYFIEHRDALVAIRKENYQLGQTVINWETESKKLLELVQKTLAE